MKHILSILLIFISYSSGASVDSFITKKGSDLKAVHKDGALWCSNGIASFRILIRKTDLSQKYPRIKIRGIQVMNDATKEVREYEAVKTVLFGANQTFVIKGGEGDGEFPALILKSEGLYSSPEHLAIFGFRSHIDANGIPVVEHSAKIKMGIPVGEDFTLSHNQNYFGADHRGARLMIHCGGYSVEEHYAYDPNPFN